MTLIARKKWTIPHMTLAFDSSFAVILHMYLYVIFRTN